MKKPASAIAISCLKDAMRDCDSPKIALENAVLTADEQIRAQSEQYKERCGIPDAKVIDAVMMKCLQKDPSKRYQSVLELQKDLAMYLRKNYAELLKTSVSVQDYNRSAFYCGDLVMINLLTGDIPTAYKYLLDFVHYSKGDVKAEAQELSEQIKMRMEEGVTEIPDELITKAEIIVHQVRIGSERRDTKKNGLDSLFE